MKCPGQDMQYWKEDAIYEVNCPECKGVVEFYKDDTTRKCNHCGHRFVNPKMDFGCAAYCQFAEQCLGTLPEDFVMQQDSLLKDKVAVEVKRFFKTDFKSIGLATKIAHYAEKIGKATEGANMAGILCSAYLLTVGYPIAHEKHDRVTKKDLETESPAIATEMLRKLGAKEELITSVCEIIGNAASLNEADEISSKIVNDAYEIAQFERELKEKIFSREDLKSRLDAINTPQGQEEASALYASAHL